MPVQGQHVRERSRGSRSRTSTGGPTLTIPNQTEQPGVDMSRPRRLYGPRPVSVQNSPYLNPNTSLQVVKPGSCPISPPISPHLGRPASPSPRDPLPDRIRHANSEDDSDVEMLVRDYNPSRESLMPRLPSKHPQSQAATSPQLPPIATEGLFANGRKSTTTSDPMVNAMPSPTLPDDQYLSLFLQANPDGNSELDLYLRAVAAQVAAFRQFGARLGPIPRSPLPRLQGLSDHQKRSAEAHDRCYTSASEDEISLASEGRPFWKRMDTNFIDEKRSRAGSIQRRVSASTTYTDAREDELETLEVLETDGPKPTVPTVRRRRSFLHRRSFAGDQSPSRFSTVQWPKARSRSAMGNVMDKEQVGQKVKTGKLFTVPTVSCV